MAATESVPVRRQPFSWRGRLTLTVVGAAVLTALAAVLDLHGLGSRSLWLDEGDSYAVASQHGARLLHAAQGDGGNMLAYYLGLHYWMALFGSSEFAMRMPSALAGIATVPVGFFLLRRLFDIRAAIFGGTFLAVSVPLVWYAQDARAYSLGVLLVCASTLVFVVAVQSQRASAWIAYALLVALAGYTILLTILIPAAHGASLMFRRRGERQTRAFLASCGCAALALVPLGLVVIGHGDRGIQWVPPPGSIVGPMNRYLVYFLASAQTNEVPFRSLPFHVVVLTMVVCWVFGFFLLVRKLRRRDPTDSAWGLALLVAWFVLPPVGTYVISVLIHPVLGDRYVIDALPPASMLAAVSLSRVRPWQVAAIAGLIVVGFRALTTVPGYGVSIENWRQATATVVSHSKNGDCIAFFVADGYTPFDYYVLHAPLTGKVPQLVLPDTSWRAHTPYVLAPQSIPESRLPLVARSCSRIWLVVSHSVGYPPGPGVLPYRVRVYTQDIALHNELGASFRATSTVAIAGLDGITLYVRKRGR